jgi:hypothetical protein
MAGKAALMIGEKTEREGGKKKKQKRKTANPPQRLYITKVSDVVYSRVLWYGKTGPKRYRRYQMNRKCRHSRGNITVVGRTVTVPPCLPVSTGTMVIPVAVTSGESITAKITRLDDGRV